MLKYNKTKGNFMDNIIDYLNKTDLNTLSITKLNELFLQIKEEAEIIKKRMQEIEQNQNNESNNIFTTFKAKYNLDNEDVKDIFNYIRECFIEIDEFIEMEDFSRAASIKEAMTQKLKESDNIEFHEIEPLYKKYNRLQNITTREFKEFQNLLNQQSVLNFSIDKIESIINNSDENTNISTIEIPQSEKSEQILEQLITDTVKTKNDFIEESEINITKLSTQLKILREKIENLENEGLSTDELEIEKKQLLKNIQSEKEKIETLKKEDDNLKILEEKRQQKITDINLQLEKNKNLINSLEDNFNTDNEQQLNELQNIRKNLLKERKELSEIKYEINTSKPEEQQPAISTPPLETKSEEKVLSTIEIHKIKELEEDIAKLPAQGKYYYDKYFEPIILKIYQNPEVSKMPTEQFNDFRTQLDSHFNITDSEIQKAEETYKSLMEIKKHIEEGKLKIEDTEYTNTKIFDLEIKRSELTIKVFKEMKEKVISNMYSPKLDIDLSNGFESIPSEPLTKNTDSAELNEQHKRLSGKITEGFTMYHPENSPFNKKNPHMAKMAETLEKTSGIQNFLLNTAKIVIEKVSDNPITKALTNRIKMIGISIGESFGIAVKKVENSVLDGIESIELKGQNRLLLHYMHRNFGQQLNKIGVLNAEESGLKNAKTLSLEDIYHEREVPLSIVCEQIDSKIKIKFGSIVEDPTTLDSISLKSYVNKTWNELHKELSESFKFQKHHFSTFLEKDDILSPIYKKCKDMPGVKNLEDVNALFTTISHNLEEYYLHESSSSLKVLNSTLGEKFTKQLLSENNLEKTIKRLDQWQYVGQLNVVYIEKLMSYVEQLIPLSDKVQTLVTEYDDKGFKQTSEQSFSNLIMKTTLGTFSDKTQTIGSYIDNLRNKRAEESISEVEQTKEALGTIKPTSSRMSLA